MWRSDSSTSRNESLRPAVETTVQMKLTSHLKTTYCASFKYELTFSVTVITITVNTKVPNVQFPNICKKETYFKDCMKRFQMPKIKRVRNDGERLYIRERFRLVGSHLLSCKVRVRERVQILSQPSPVIEDGRVSKEYRSELLKQTTETAAH